MRDQFVTEEFLFARRAILEQGVESSRSLLPASYRTLVRRSFDLAKVGYCLGDPLDVVKEAFREACEVAIEWGGDLGLPSSTYPVAGMLRMFGLDELREQMIPQTRHGEWTVRRPHDFLMGFAGLDDDANYSSAMPGKPMMHVRTWRLIETARVDRDAASEMLVEFVVKHWGNVIKKEPWAGTHHDVTLPYAGYWAYGPAAVAQMFGLDDAALEGHRYYPYDLAHFE